MKRQEYDHKKIEGVDVNIETSLKEYGKAWIETETEVLFYYGIEYGPNDDLKEEYIKFDFCVFDKTMNVKDEYDWANFQGVSDYIGQDIFELPFIQQIIELSRYYGYENVFGSTYWEGLKYKDIVS